MPAPKLKTVSTPVVYTNDQILNAATGQWGERAHEVKPAEPYHIQVPDGEDIIVPPLTRRRRKALKTAQAAYLLVGAQLAEAENEGNAEQSTITRIQSLMEEAEVAYDDALFGEVRGAVYDFYDDLDEVWWDAMYADVHAKLVNRVELPEDVCSKCGHKAEKEGDDEDGEGKGASSST